MFGFSRRHTAILKPGIASRAGHVTTTWCWMGHPINPLFYVIPWCYALLGRGYAVFMFEGQDAPADAAFALATFLSPLAYQEKDASPYPDAPTRDDGRAFTHSYAVMEQALTKARAQSLNTESQS